MFKLKAITKKKKKPPIEIACVRRTHNTDTVRMLETKKPPRPIPPKRQNWTLEEAKADYFKNNPHCTNCSFEKKGMCLVKNRFIDGKPCKYYTPKGEDRDK